MPNYQDEINGVSISEAYAEAASSAPIDRVVYYTYELTHPTFTERVLIVNDFAPITVTLEDGTEAEFTACPVSVTPPEESDESATPNIRINIDGVSGIVAAKLDEAVKTMERIGIIERVYVSDDLSAPAVMPPLRLTLRDVEVTEQTVSASAAYDDPINRGFPGKDYLPREYPGLAAR